jgi:hypothetical protein
MISNPNESDTSKNICFNLFWIGLDRTLLLNFGENIT